MTWKTLDDLACELDPGAKMIVVPVDDDVADTGIGLDVTILYPDGSQIGLVSCPDGWRFPEERSYSDVVRD